MTDQEIIDVVKAHQEGKKIEFRWDPRFQLKANDWVLCTEYNMWDFSIYEYRVKPEPKFRPYKNAEEFMEARRTHGPALIDRRITAYIQFVMPAQVGLRVYFKDLAVSYDELLYSYTWMDGTSCGIKE